MAVSNFFYVKSGLLKIQMTFIPQLKEYNFNFNFCNIQVLYINRSKVKKMRCNE